MKTLHLTPLACFALAVLPAVHAQDAAPATPPPAATAPAAAAKGPGLRFNFRGAPLETVLNYMSEAAGFVIVLDTPVRGTVDMWSAQPVSRDEAVQLLNVALSKAGYAATVQGRTLVVSSKDDAKKRNIPIRTGNDPEEIPSNAEMVMQIIPLRHIDATQASRDLGTLLPGSATLTANADSNSLLVTDTNINLKHIVELVSALDTSIDTVSTLKIFKLKNADPYEMAALLTSLYGTPLQSNANGRGGQNGQIGQNGGRGGFAGGGAGAFIAAALGGGGGGGNGNRSGRGSSTSARAVPVVAVADPRTFSVIVSAAKEAMPDIAEMINQLDASPARKQKVFVYTMENADVKQVETTLKNLFQSTTQRNTTSNQQADPLNTRATTNAQQNTTTNLQLGTTTGGGRGGE